MIFLGVPGFLQSDLDVAIAVATLRPVSAWHCLGNRDPIRLFICSFNFKFFYRIRERKVLCTGPRTVFGVCCISLQVVVMARTLCSVTTRQKFGNRHPVQTTIHRFLCFCYGVAENYVFQGSPAGFLGCICVLDTMKTIAALYSVSSIHFLGYHYPVQAPIVSSRSACDSFFQTCIFVRIPWTMLSGWCVLLKILETTAALRSISARQFLGNGHPVHVSICTPFSRCYNVF